ncbi:Coiled-coil domain-containing protein 86 [Geodia barretti]|uniref:Coiled-coil domain-containing protein 86 n=1 Tax=Geodia barretti TaxID=519541 RepID=A0AA35X952_GEOBA|nr:Coiled-coil domain-containing protein 86 [Geodia barretti]
MKPGEESAPRGKPKSGRVWKSPGTKHRDCVAVPPLKKPYKVRRAQESERRAVREMEREMKEAKDKEKETSFPEVLYVVFVTQELRKRLQEKRERKLENQRKGEIVQKITNVTKLKRLKKKQLRTIEKR